MRINREIITTAASAVKSVAKHCESKVSNPILHISAKDIFIKEAPLLRKPLTYREIARIKPSEFKQLIADRTDIPKEIAENLYGPEDMRLFDVLNNYFLEHNYSLTQRTSLLKNVFSRDKYLDYGFINCKDIKSMEETIPRLLNKGYDANIVTQLKIDNLNKNLIEQILDKKNLLKDVASKIEYCTDEEAYICAINNILTSVDSNNVKYIEECYRLTGDELFLPLHYWRKDTGKIFEKYMKNMNHIQQHITLDRLFRNKHNIQTVKQIFGDSEFTPVTEKLLEFKNFNKYKNIDLSSYKNISLKEKIEFIKSYIKALAPYDVKFPSQSGGFDNYPLLAEKMSIFKELNYSSEKEFANSYQELLEKLLNELPPKARKPIQNRINYGSYLSKYRKANPIPSMVDDLSKLESKQELIDGKYYDVSVIESNPTFGIATHRIPDGGSILNIEALECTDPEEILCIGKKGGKKLLNFYRSGYALAVKPRLNNDWWIQSVTDIDTGTNAAKNIFHIERFTLRTGGGRDFKLIPETIKRVLNLSQAEYTKRINAVKKCSTIDEIEVLDRELAAALRKINTEVNTSEGLMRPEVMGVLVDYNKPLEKIDKRILDYIHSRKIKIIRVKEPEHQITKKAEGLKNFKFIIETT